MVKITGRSNANNKNTSKKFSLIYSSDCILTGISRLFNAFQADGEYQSDLQIVLIDANIPGQEPSHTGHSGTDTAHEYTGSKSAKAVCLENIFLSELMAVTGFLRHCKYPPKKRRAILSASDTKPNKDWYFWYPG